MSREDFAAALRKWRTGNKWLQKEAANILGASIRTYQGWEEGTHLPNKFALIEIERRMNNHKNDLP